MSPCVTLCFLLAVPPAADPPQPKSVNEKIVEVAGTAEFLRSVPKHFATLQAVDAAHDRVTLLIEGEKLAKVWPLAPDAEVKVMGWWGRLDQLVPGDRVWVWFQTDRKKQPAAVAMLADEISQQDIHGKGVTLEAIEAGTITVRPVKGEKRTLKAAAPATDLAAGGLAYVQSSGDKARLVLTPAAFEDRRNEQKAALRKRWADEGLPGTVTFLHRFSGEMELMLDHEAMRWGRSLLLGDKVSLTADPPIAAVVKHVKPWRERTQVRLVVHGADQTDLRLGQRVRLKMQAPAAEVDSAVLPPDLDRPRSPEERVEWFLASIYCTCKVMNDTCTGHFYTLASCNPNGCGMPNALRKTVAGLIEQGLSDRQIFEALLKEHGPDLLRPHLLP
jgi:hypothetical protein